MERLLVANYIFEHVLRVGTAAAAVTTAPRGHLSHSASAVAAAATQQ